MGSLASTDKADIINLYLLDTNSISTLENTLYVKI